MTIQSRKLYGWFSDQITSAGSAIDLTDLNSQVEQIKADIRDILNIIQPQCDHCGQRNCTYKKED